MFFIFVLEAELLEDYQLSNRVSAYLDLLVDGFQCHLLLQLIVCLTQNKIVHILNIIFIHIFIPHFLKNGLVNVLLFEEGRICVRLGTLNTRSRDDCWHLWVRSGCWCLVHGG